MTEWYGPTSVKRSGIGIVVMSRAAVDPARSYVIARSESSQIMPHQTLDLGMTRSTGTYGGQFLCTPKPCANLMARPSMVHAVPAFMLFAMTWQMIRIACMLSR